MNTLQISEQELKSLVEKANQFVGNADGGKSVKDNLSAMLAQKMPGMASDTCEQVVEGLVKGVVTFTDTYHEFCQNDGMDLYGRCMDLIKNEPAEMQAACILNFVAVLKTMDASVLNEALGNAGTDLVSKFDEFRGATVSEDISGEQIEQLCAQLKDALANNSVCLAGEEQVKELLSALNHDEGLAKSLVNKKASELDSKCYVALAAYVSCKYGELESVPEDVEPEILGASVAAGVERAKVMEDVKARRISWDQAFKLLKFVGGALLYALFIWIKACIAVLGVIAASFFCSVLMQSCAIGIMAGLVIGGYAAYKAMQWFDKYVEEPVLEGLGEVYDRATGFFCANIPILVDKIVAFWAYLKEQGTRLFKWAFGSEEEQQTISITD